MKEPFKKIIAGAIATCFVAVTPLLMAKDEGISLPKPKIDDSTPIMKVLLERKSIRAYSDKELPIDVLSDLLWAAFGINRPDSGKRTAPSAVNWQEIDIYVALKNGVYLYDAPSHSLKLHMKKDIREETGMQGFVKTAPVNLIYVADYSKYRKSMKDSDKKFYSGTDTGFISENVYIYCAAKGLGTVVRGMVDREKLRKVMNLKSNQRITFCQTVGYPK